MRYEPGVLMERYDQPVLIVAGWSSKTQIGSFSNEAIELELDDEIYVILQQWNVRIMSWYRDMII